MGEDPESRLDIALLVKPRHDVSILLLNSRMLKVAQLNANFETARQFGG
ncbi:MAG: hypothetical protein M3082_08330 [Candidatus Dormibacteraeota bacterium]|nr:hypothetical protein [Candidatus Dormibacteraeota bacterium]